jgi:hypothetical protein
MAVLTRTSQIHIFNKTEILKKNSTTTILCKILQAERVRDAAWGCDWVGTPVPFQRCLVFIIATANKEFTLTAGKFVPVSNSTMMNVRIKLVRTVF